MKPHDFLMRLLRPKPQRQPEPARLPTRPTRPAKTLAAAALRMLAPTQDVELACDDVHALLDQFAEVVKRGEDAPKAMPLLQLHLDMCPDCREEFEALMRVLRANPAA